MTAEKARENKARRAAARQGLTLVKSRRRDWRAFDFGTYMLVNDQASGAVVLGAPVAGPNGSATIEEVEAYLNGE